MQKERNPFRGVKLFFIAYFSLLVLILTGIGAMNWLGYRMADLSIQFALMGLLICSALIALGVWIAGRFMNRGVKVMVYSVCGILAFAAAAAMMFVYSMTTFSSMPVHYTTITSPSGRGAVVLRSISQNQDAADARRADRIAADPDANADEYALSDLAYAYSVHPRTAGLFYNMKVQGEGSLEIGCTSAAQLMYEWMDENTLRLYVENPEAQDGGELMLSLQ